MAAVAVVAVAGALVAGFALPGGQDGGAKPTQAYRLPTVVDHGIPFYTDPGGNRLVTHRVGRPGQSSVKFSYGPARGAMMPVAVCTATYSKQHPYYVHIVADGSPALDMPCAGKRDFTHPEHAMFIAYEEPVTSVIGNIDFGQANFGSKMTMEAWISEGLHGPITKVPGARVGVAVYAHDPHMLRTHGLYVARQIVVHDHTYALAAHVFKNLTTRGDVTLRLPSPPARLDVVGGVGAWSSGFRVTGMTGYHTSQPRAITSAMSFDFEQPGPGTRTETIAISGKPDSSGFLYLLAYRRID